MSQHTLVTFGCSWTYGVGAAYEPGMVIDQYRNPKELDIENSNRYSWRTLLSNRRDWRNINFASGGSSNQRQFRLAKQFFVSEEFRKLDPAKVVVAWGITSTARNELFNTQTHELDNFFYTEQSMLAKTMTMFVYDHDNEVAQLNLEMKHWDSYFKSLGVRNCWFDTFNHHVYPDPAPTLIGHNQQDRDLMSCLVRINGGAINDRTYHESDWRIDGPRVQFLVDKGILNPHSQHPGRHAHEQLCDFFQEHIDNLIQ